MSDENKKGDLRRNDNLEPITEKDIDLANKFGHIEKESIGGVGGEKDISPAEKERMEGVIEKDLTYQQVLTQAKKVSDDNSEGNVKADAKKVSEIADAESRINNLVDLATHKGVVHAVKVAKHLDDNYILDELHDRLVTDELRESLLKKGMIKDE